MMDLELLEAGLAELPLYGYFFIDPNALEFSQRIRWICENECPMHGKTWACPPGVGSVESCKAKCLSHKNCLMVVTVTEVEDISDLEENLSKETLDNLRGISDILDNEDLLVDGSIFHNLTTKEKLQYLDAYIQYQYDLDEHQFYNEAEHTMDFSPDFLSTINIWGEEFEEWAQKQFDYSMYEI